MTTEGPEAALADRPGPRPVVAAPPGRPHLLVAGLALAVFVVLFALVAPHDAAAWEGDLVDRATRLPELVGWPLRLVMQLGRRALVPLVGVAVGLATRRWPPVVVTVVAGLVAAQTVDLLKEWASRPRPEGLPVREAADGFGFPSGHSTVAWALATVIATQVPRRWRWVPFVMAAMVAVARMNAGVHYPLDVVGGSLWGLAVGGLVVVVATAVAARLGPGPASRRGQPH